MADRRAAMRNLLGDPGAVRMTGDNPLSPGAPKQGVYGISQWGSSTKHVSYPNPPEGWNTLAAREANGEEIRYVVIWPDWGTGSTKGYCLDMLDARGFEPLYSAPSDYALDELAALQFDDDEW